MHKFRGVHGSVDDDGDDSGCRGELSNRRPISSPSSLTEKFLVAIECCSDKSDFVIMQPPEYRSVEGLKVSMSKVLFSLRM